MARFVINQAIDTRESTIVVDEGLPVGQHRFQLIVFDDSGNKSRPDIVTIEISDPSRPTPTGPGPLGLVVPVGPRISVAPVGPVVGPPDPVGPIIREPIDPIRVSPPSRRRKPSTRRRHSDKKE